MATSQAERPGALMPLLRIAAQRMLNRVDAWYSRRHDLQAVGPVLRIGRVRYRGPPRQFADGTVLHSNDLIGQLHFNNGNIAAIGEGSTHRSGLRFARLMRESLRSLAHVMQADPRLQDIAVFQGVTWMRAHGEVVGFESQALPRSWRTRWQTGYFRLLLWTFSPSARARATRLTEPRLYWLTRSMLQRHSRKLAK